MKYISTFILVAILFQSCSVSDNEKQSTGSIPNGLHYSDEMGIRPVSLLKSDSSYLMIYATDNEWKGVSSNNLLDWKDSIIVDVPYGATGDVIIDHTNLLETPNGSKSLVVHYFDNGPKMKYSTNGVDWIDKKVDWPELVNGTPKLLFSKNEKKWLMIVSDQSTASLLSSSNLLEWESIGSFPLPPTSQLAQLIEYNNDIYLLALGSVDHYQKIDSTYEVVAEWALMDQSIGGTNAMYSNIAGKTLSWRSIATHQLCVGHEIQFDNTGSPRIDFINSLTNRAVSKRRSKLENLKSKGASRFTFRTDSFYTSSKITFHNDQGERASLEFSLIEKNIRIDLSKSSNSTLGDVKEFEWILPTKTIEVDVLIDYSCVELLMNQGSTHIALDVRPVFIYDQISVELDNQKFDAKGVLYALSEKQSPERMDL